MHTKTGQHDEVVPLALKAGLPRKRLHDARHGAEDMLLDAGVDLKVIQAWLGHSTITLTANTYLRARKPLMGEAARKLAAIFGARKQ